MSSSQKLIVDSGGGARPEQLVDAFVALARALWWIILDSRSGVGEIKSSNDRKRYVSRQSVRDSFYSQVRRQVLSKKDDGELLDNVIQVLVDVELMEAPRDKPQHYLVDLDVFSPHNVVSIFRSRIAAHQDVEYFLRRSIRCYYEPVLTPAVARVFHLLASTLNAESHRVRDSDDLRPEGAARYGFPGSGSESGLKMNPNRNRTRLEPEYFGNLLPELQRVLESDVGSGVVYKGLKMRPIDPRRAVMFFIEACLAVGYLRPSTREGRVELRSNAIDAEYLISRLYGLPTGIRGLDELFGGGGLILSESSTDAPGKGRVVLISGPSGSGKTLLALQYAAEVARKGGVSWIVAFEQSADECLYALESTYHGTLTNVDVLLASSAAADALLDVESGRGRLIILRLARDSMSSFYWLLEKSAETMARYPLRSITIDPFNSLESGEGETVTSQRAELVDVLTRVTSAGTNVFLVKEDDRGEIYGVQFVHNIADTVIHLFTRQQSRYAQRYFEIVKSRYQREQRGEHPFSIVPGVGFRIWPSTAAVAARLRSRAVHAIDLPVRFGVEALDRVIGERSLRPRDVIALVGPSGCFKTAVGLQFLFETDWREPDRIRHAASMLVSTRYDAPGLLRLLEHGYELRDVRESAPKSSESVALCPLDRGYVSPGAVFQSIDDVVESVKFRGQFVERVLVDGVAAWSHSCPFIAEDQVFGDTIVDYFRKHAMTSVFLCSEDETTEPTLVQKAIVDRAHCLIRFRKEVDVAGRDRVLLRVERSGRMKHSREWHRLFIGADGIELVPQ